MCDDLVRRNVICNVGQTIGLVLSLQGEDIASNQHGDLPNDDELRQLSSVQDWEQTFDTWLRYETDPEAIIAAAEHFDLEIKGRSKAGRMKSASQALVEELKTGPLTYEEVCQHLNLEPEEREVYEHWAVDSHFASYLRDFGEAVVEVLDFQVWCRTCTGQAISMDHVIREIASKMEILPGQKYDWSKKS